MDKEKPGRKSASIVPVFLLELVSIVGLGVLAYLLRYTNNFEVVKRDFSCKDTSLMYPKNPPYKNSIIFNSVPVNTFYLIFLLAPIGVILVLEIVRLLIMLGLSHSTSNNTVIQKKIGIPFPIYIRRIIRISGGFLFGFLMTSIMVDILKRQTGVLKPYFWDVCSVQNLTRYCRSLGGQKENQTIVEEHCANKEILREWRMSFPSIGAATATYAGFFLLMYLAFALPYRALGFLRLWAMLAITIGVALLFNAGLAINEHHVLDMVFAFLIGLFFSIYIVFIHLNAFANRLSVSNFLGAKRSNDSINTIDGHVSLDPFDEGVSHSNLFADNGDKEWFWKNFHIPRVHTLRQSARNMWRKSENYFSSRPNATNLDSAPSTPKSNHQRNSNAYINPAFNGRDNDNNILANHLHQETRFGNGTAGGIGGSSITGNQRNPLRTFQAS